MLKKQRAYGLVNGKEDKIGLTTVNGHVIRLKCQGYGWAIKTHQ